MKKTITTELSAANIARVLALLAETPTRLESLCQHLDEPVLRTPLGPGRRSIAEIIAHLINVEARTNEAIVLALTLDQSLLANIHAERDYGRLMRHDRLPVADCLAYFRLRRTVLLGLLESLTDDRWARVVREAGKQRRESVYWRARGLALHEVEHIDEIRNSLSPGSHGE